MKKKKQKKKHPPSSGHPKQTPKGIESVESDQMLDDHGNVVIGDRNKEPKNLDEDSSNQ